MPKLSDVTAALDRLYVPAWAESWDAVGLVCGDPGADVRKVMFAVDPVQAVADEAVAWGADLLVTHHPLYLRGTTSVAADTFKGRVVHTLVTGGCALHVAHTNADSADPGVSDALAAALGLDVAGPLDPGPPGPPGSGETRDAVVVLADDTCLTDVLKTLTAAGAGALAMTGVDAHGSGARTRVEATLDRAARTSVMRALAVLPGADAHVQELAFVPGPRGIGRIGELPEPESLEAFAARAAAALPATAGGLRVAGDPERVVRTVAVCGGAGDSLLGAVRRARADVYLTADLRHHPASEALEAGGPALVDAAHWATEWPWLTHAAAALTRALGASGDTVDGVVETRVSTLATDPWTFHTPSTIRPSAS